MRLSLFSYDIGAAKNLLRVGLHALDKGHRISFVGNDDLMGCASIAKTSDVVITGLASVEAGKEVALGLAAEAQGISWLVFADTHRAWARRAIQPFASKARAIVASPTEIDQATEFGYADAVFLGGPPLWREFAKVVTPIEVVSAVRNQSRNAPFIVLVGGNKDASMTDAMLGTVRDACSTIFFGDKWSLVFKPHPNEDKATVDLDRRARILAGVNVLHGCESIPTTSLIPAVDFSVFTSGATDTISASYLRKTVFYFENEAVRARMIKQTGEPTWFPAECGACCKVEDSQDIIRAIDRRSFEAQRERQEAAYPILDVNAESLILDYAQSLVRK